MGDKNLNIIQANVRSIYAPGRYAETKIMAYSKKPHLICISESWLKNSSKPTDLIGYHEIRKDRQDREGGGLIFLVRDNLKYKHIHINTNQNGIIEADAIEINLAHDKVKILHIYNPEATIDINEFDRLINQMGRKFIIVGDLNAHHTMWDPDLPQAKINQGGRILANYLLNHPGVSLVTTPGLGTHTSLTYRSSSISTIDLSFASNNLIQVSNTTKLGGIGSDHYPVLTTVMLAPGIIPQKKRKKWKNKNANWDIWNKGFEPSPPTNFSLEEASETFTNSLTNKAEELWGKTSGTIKTKFSSPWWTVECARVVAGRRRAKKRVEKRPSLDNLIEYRRLAAIARRIIKKNKVETWRKFCSTISAETPPKKIWRMIRKMSGKGRQRSSPLNVNGRIIDDPKQKADIIAEHLDTIIGQDPTRMNDTQTRIVEEGLQSNDESGYNMAFTLQELNDSLESLKSGKSMGDDDVENEFLKFLPDHKKTELLNLINQSWIESNIPRAWKHSLVIPILKDDKEAQDPDSYRPISLTSCVSKVAEKMINNRLAWQLEKTNQFSPTQSGFRKGRSAEDLIINLEHQVRSSLVNRRVTIIVFLDLKQAFDTVSHDHLLLKLAKSGIQGRLLRWIQEFLKNRTYEVLMDDQKSDTKQSKRGVPQGSILSPSTFALLMAEIPHLARVCTMEYADDVAMSITADTIQEAYDLTVNAINKLEEWAQKWELSFNPRKTKAMIFTKKRIPKDADNQPVLPTLKLNGENIRWEKTFRYLGMKLDGPTLTWKHHIDDLRDKCAERLKILRALTGTSWGPDRTNILNLYKTYIRSKITYGAVALASASKTNLNRLEVIQSSAIRIAIGARKTSPNIALQVEAGLPPLREHIKELCCRYYFKLKAADQHPTAELVLNDEEVRDRFWTPGVFKMPFEKRTEGHLSGWNISKNINVKYNKQPTAPPWSKRMEIETELLEEVDKTSSREQAREVAERTIHFRYEQHLKIFTDGSISGNSTTSAMWVPHMNAKDHWKLNIGQARSTMGAELHAISKALHWTVINSAILPTEQIVILSDSKSGLQGIKKYSTKTYTFIIDQIRKTAATLQDIGISVCLQWVPSHVGVGGNEMADGLANSAHNLQEETLMPLDLSEMKNLIREEHTKDWQRFYDGVRPNLHIGNIKEKTSPWSWLPHKHRRIDVAMARLRIGHVGLNEYLTRFNMANDQNCSLCNIPETVTHLLADCRKYTANRDTLQQKLRAKGITNTSVKTLLGGGNYDKETQLFIQDTMGKFLLETGVIKNL